MATTTKKKVVQQPAPITISHCNFDMGSPANEHSRAAVVALASAAEANAKAIEAVALALKGSASYGIHITQGSPAKHEGDSDE